MPDKASPDWMEETGFGVIGRFTLEDGEQLTAEIVGYEEEMNELVVRLIPISREHGNGEQATRAIAVDSVLSFHPEPRSSHTWPHSDPCRNSSFSGWRFTLMASLFLLSTAGSLLLFITLMNGEPYRLQELSAVAYSFAVVFATFAALRGAQPFLFSCPAVTPQIPKLIWRHVGFLVALFLLQTAALAVRPSLPAWWNLRDSKGETPFEVVLLFLCFGLGFVQVYTNRSVLHALIRSYLGSFV